MTTDPDPTALLDWYDRHARALPWRVPPGDRAIGVLPDPYRVWLSEIMLQQTTVQAVKPYFAAFTMRWPTVADLARADANDVMTAWAGLGYYSRARNLKACADHVANELSGRFPETEEDLQALPGIGPYTAAAIAAIAFDVPAAVVDGNVERVVTRLFAIDTPLPGAKAEIRAKTAALTPNRRPGDFAQAMMDLGATICTPKRPACALCPWRPACKAVAEGKADLYPKKAPKAERPTRRGTAYVAVRTDGAILVRRRPPRGLLGGMVEVPGSDWATPPRRRDGAATPAPEVPFTARWAKRPVPVSHTFTHFHLELDVHVADVDVEAVEPDGHWWATDWRAEALPSVMVKVVRAALDD